MDGVVIAKAIAGALELFSDMGPTSSLAFGIDARRLGSPT